MLSKCWIEYRHFEISSLSPCNSEYRLQSLDALQLELISEMLEIKTESEQSSVNCESALILSIYWGAHNKSKDFEVLNTYPKERLHGMNVNIINVKTLNIDFILCFLFAKICIFYESSDKCLILGKVQ